jgi:UDP-N-acetylmuramoyl-tripeptide--D-alanyl-D-alanine ligase
MSAFGGARNLGLEGTEVLWAGVPVRLALPGRFNLLNALGAAAIAEEAGVSADAIRRGMAAAAPLFGRGEILRGSVTVVRDCYNANPEAIEAALEFCDSLDWSGRRIYVIGSMLELGAASEEEHRRIGQALAGSRADLVFLYGPETESIRQFLREQEEASAALRPALVFRTDDMETLKQKISAAVRPGDLVLLKGSRGTALERLTDLFDVKENGPCS